MKLLVKLSPGQIYNETHTDVHAIGSQPPTADNGGTSLAITMVRFSPARLNWTTRVKDSSAETADWAA